MNNQQLKYFLAVAEKLNFTRVAEQYYISQTAVTQQIKALEKELDVQLFYRTKRHVELTPAGMTLVEEAKGILAKTQEAITKTKIVAHAESGNLSIGFIKGYENSEFPKFLQEFRALYPGCALILKRDNTAELNEDLLNHKHDIILNIDFENEEIKHLNKRNMKKYDLQVALYPNHPLAGRSSIKRSELKNDKFISSEMHTDKKDGTEVIIKSYMEAGFIPRVVNQSKDIETILLLVSTGMGIAVIPEYMAVDYHKYMNLVYIPLEGENDSIDIIAVWDKENPNPMVDKFITLVQKS